VINANGDNKSDGRKSVPENQISTGKQQAHKADACCDQGSFYKEAISGHGRKISLLPMTATEFDR
jgi:hypothetical protein